MRSIVASTLAIILVLTSAGTALGQTSWTVTVLDPNFSTSASASGNTGTQQVGTANFSWGGRAALWTGTPGSFVNLNPSGAMSSAARGTSGAQQVGWGNFSGGARAVTWAGTGGGHVDLNPGARTSRALATTGAQQAGWATFSWEVPVAALWSGTAGSFVNLNPSGARDSRAYGMGGSQQVGVAGFGNFGLNPTYRCHAALWTGSAGSFVDLNPAGASNSYAYATSGTQQGGAADGHAGIWSGTAASFVDLNPAGALSSAVYATTGTWQAGYADVGPDARGVGHACVWQGTPESFVDLDVLLPPAVRGGGSWASAIYVSGQDIWVTGGTFGGHAIIWHAVLVDLTIKKFFDCDNDGVYDQADDDKMLSGWQFQVKDPNDTVIGTYATDQNGEVTVPGLLAGDYTVTETVKKDHYVTGTAGNPRVVSVSAEGGTVTWFGNKLDGDVNQDGLVDIQDFFIIKDNFDQSPTTWTQGNLNFTQDDLVDIQDFFILKDNFDKGVAP